MTGWKTKSASLLSIVYGAFGIFAGLHDPATGVQMIVTGIGLAGIGHKIEKSAA